MEAVNSKTQFKIALLTTALFSVITLFFRHGWVADDYHYLSLAIQNQLTLSTFGNVVARMPIPTMIDYFIFLNFRSFPYVVIILFFFVQTISILWLSETVRFWMRALPDSGEIVKENFLTSLLLPALILLIPITYELVYWPVASPYIIGLFFSLWLFAHAFAV